MITLKKLIFTGIIAIFAFSCHSDKNVKKQAKKSGIVSKNSLDYYYSSNINQNEKNIPLILIIDPHGNGKLAVEKFNQVINQNHCLLIGLNNVKNNTPNFYELIYKTINDAAQSFPIDKSRIYLAGFSGGARMAFQYAINYGCSGLIMCGARPGNIGNKNIPFPLVMISGTQDFNFVEQYYSPYSDVAKKPNLIALHFNGKHEWPSDDLLLQAYEFISRYGQDQNINTFITSSQELEDKGDYLLSFKQLELASKIAEVSKSEKINQAINTLLSKQKFKNYIENLEHELNNEMQRNRSYYQALESENFEWWKNEIQLIDKNINDSTINLNSDSFARSKAFLGIFLYSEANSLIHQSNNKKLLNKTLSIYELIEPKNPDVFYFKSLNCFLNQDTVNCVNNMKKAFKFGFSDLKKLKNDFPENMWVSLTKNGNNE